MRLQADNLTPVGLKVWDGRGATTIAGLGRRQLADFLHDLGALVSAGVPFRQSLIVMGQDEQDRGLIARVARAIEVEVSAGYGLGEALGRALGSKGATLAGLVAAGEASGDLGGALARGAENLSQELEVADGLVAAVSYPLLVLLMTMGTLVVILTVVVPTLQPLMDQQEQAPPVSLAVLFAISQTLAQHGLSICIALMLILVAAVVGWRFGLLRPLVESWILDGPLAGISRPIVFGGVGAMAGSLLSARVNASDALRLALTGASLSLARRRLEVCVEQIREGASVSEALSGCRGLPGRMRRLAAIGEETGRLGPMLQRAGRLERDQALRRLKATSQWLGPVLIVLLGGVIGLVFASLLTGITSLGAIGGGS
jgi:type II secretory pathway component PulF